MWIVRLALRQMGNSPLGAPMSYQTHDFSMLTSQQNQHRIETLQNSLTLRIITTSVLIFVCYFTVGLQLAVGRVLFICNSVTTRCSQG
jgi:hypothetical protein